jgi:hypothetical protein
MPAFASPRIHGDRSDHSHGHRCIVHVASDDSVEGDKTAQVWMESDKEFWFARKKVSLKSASHRSNDAGLLRRFAAANLARDRSSNGASLTARIIYLPLHLVSISASFEREFAVSDFRSTGSNGRPHVQCHECVWLLRALCR